MVSNFSMDLDKLRIFYYIAKAGSLNRAAEDLNVSQPSLTRSMQVLEHSLKTKLFMRHPKGLTLTHEGEIWFDHAKRAIAELETARALVEEDSKIVKGNLKITTTFGFASTVLFPYLTEFLKTYPNVNLSLICDDTNLDLYKRGADVAIGPRWLHDPTITQTYLTTRKLNIYASAKYLEEYGEPKTPQDLDNHKLIVFSLPNDYLPYSITKWLLTVGASPGIIRTPYMTVNSTECLFQAASQDLGLIALSNDSSYLKNSNLVQILNDLESPTTDIFISYPKNLKNIRRIRALEGFLVDEFSLKQKVVKLAQG